MVDDRCFSLQSTPSCSWRYRWKSRYGAHKRGLNTKVHLAVDANGMPVRVIITKGTEADCKQALALIDGIIAEMLLADKAYDTNEIIEYAIKNGIQAVIPPKRNRIEQREYDEYVYRIRHLVENAFLKLKRWRGVATRYAKTVSAFRGAVVACCILQWLRVLV